MNTETHTTLWQLSIRAVVAFSLLVGLTACSGGSKASGGGSTAPQTQTWAIKAPMPTPRGALGAATVNGIVYAIGGGTAENGSAPLATAEAYNPATNIWSAKAPMPTPRQVAGIAVVNGIIYVIGGQDGSQPGIGLRAVEAYDPNTNTWTIKAPMPTARGALACAVVNGIIYSIGGKAINDGNLFPVLATVEAYDPGTNTWSTKASMPTARNGLGVGVLNGIIYAVGGNNDSTVPPFTLATVEAYDPTTNTWLTRAAMANTREGPGVGEIDGTLYAVGGQEGSTDHGAILTSMEAFNPTTNSWTARPSMLTQRIGMATSVANGRLYVVGGAVIGVNSFVLSRVLEEYTP